MNSLNKYIQIFKGKNNFFKYFIGRKFHSNVRLKIETKTKSKSKIKHDDIHTFLLYTEEEKDIKINKKKNKIIEAEKNDNNDKNDKNDKMTKNDKNDKNDKNNKNRNEKPKMTTLKIGTLYEYHTINLLRQLQFSLVRTGGACDGGVDFRGHWLLPTPFEILSETELKEIESGFDSSEYINEHNKINSLIRSYREIMIVGQCKAFSKPIGSSVINQLKGAMLDLSPNTIGIICCSSKLSQRAIKSFNSTKVPLIYALIDMPDINFGGINGFILNNAAENLVGYNPVVQNIKCIQNKFGKSLSYPSIMLSPEASMSL